MIEVNYITTKSGKEKGGRLLYEEEIRKRLKNVKLNKIEYLPSKINLPGISFLARAINKIGWFPYQVKQKVKRCKISHLTSEDLAFLLNFIKLEKTIITCFDLARWVYYPKSVFWRFNIKGCFYIVIKNWI